MLFLNRIFSLCVCRIRLKESDLQNHVCYSYQCYEQVFHTKTLGLYSEIPGFTGFFSLTCIFQDCVNYHMIFFYCQSFNKIQIRPDKGNLFACYRLLHAVTNFFMSVYFVFFIQFLIFFSFQVRYFYFQSTKKNFRVLLYEWNSSASRLQRSHYKETVYFLPLSPQEILALAFYRLYKDERLSRRWSHLLVLNSELLYWEFSALTTRLFIILLRVFGESGIVRQRVKSELRGSWFKFHKH